MFLTSGSSAEAQAGYQVQRSLRLRASATATLSRTPSAAGNRKTWTWSGWVKLGALSTAGQQIFSAENGSGNYTVLQYGGTLAVYNGTSLIGASNFVTTAVFNDPAAWYHVVVTVDTTQAIVTDRVKLYVNNVQQTWATVGSTQWEQNVNTWVNAAALHRHGKCTLFGGLQYDGYLADVYLIDGQALTPTSFGEYSAYGYWQPKLFVPTTYAAPFPDFNNATDPYYTSVKLQVRGNGTSGATTTTDDSSAGYNLTGSGGAVIDTTNYKFGGSSMYFPGSPSYFSTPNINFGFGTGDFTIEAWVRVTSLASGTLSLACQWGTTGQRAWMLVANTSGFYVSTTSGGGGVSDLVQAGYGLSIVLGQWYHIAAVRSGTSLKFYVNGVVGGSVGTISSIVSVNQPVYIGKNIDTNTWYHQGNIDNLRVTVGVARYTSNFNPNGNTGYGTNGFHLPFEGAVSQISEFPNSAPSDPNFANVVLLAHFNGADGTSSFTDNSNLAHAMYSIGGAMLSTTQSRFGGTSLKLDTTNYASISSNSNFNFLSGVYTVEAWVCPDGSSLVGRNPGIVMRGMYSTNGGNWSGLSFGMRAIQSAVRFYFYGTTNANEQFIDSATGVLTTGTWTHLAMVRNGTTGYAFVNGNLIGTITGLNTLTASTQPVMIGNFDYDANLTSNNPLNTHFGGYIDEVRITSGVARYTSNFVPNASTVSSAAIGSDTSGNGNNWTPTNISLAADATCDSMLDVPLGGGGGELGNYATLNPLVKASGANTTYSNGNLAGTIGTTSNGHTCISTIAIQPGMKAYFEGVVTTGVYTTSCYFGIIHANDAPNDILNSYTGQTSRGYGYGRSINSNLKYNNNTSSAYGALLTNGSVVGIAFDNSAGTLEFFHNGVSQGVAFTGIPSGDYLFSVGAAGWVVQTNFGQYAFTYTPPLGFKPLHTGNLSTPVVASPKPHFTATTYTGISVTVNNTTMQPDLVWIKSRSTATAHVLVDTARGISNTLTTVSAASQVTDATAVTAITPTGFTVGTNTLTNATGSAYVAWQWGGCASVVTNTAGSIPSQVRANTAAGFSIVTYTGGSAGASVGHGLGAKPDFIITKRISGAAADWAVHHSALPISNTLYLNTTYSSTQYPNRFGATSSTTFTMGSVPDEVGLTGLNYVAYCFTSVAGYSKFGSYTGNGSADGTFVYCGFKPAFLIIKRIDSTTANWNMFDAARSPTNTVNRAFFPNGSGAEIEDTNRLVDFVSNGFKLRQGAPAPITAEFNGNGGAFIFIAFAEAPLKYALAR